MRKPWQGCCFDLREQPELFDVILLWLHTEWLKQRKSASHNPAEAYALRRIQLQQHLSYRSLPLTIIAKELNARSKPVLGCVSLTPLVSSQMPASGQCISRSEYLESSDSWFSAKGYNALWLSNLFVTPTARGRGIADALLMSAQAKAKHLGWSELYLYTQSSKNYYLAKGWREIKIKPSPPVSPTLSNMSVLTKQLGAHC